METKLFNIWSSEGIKIDDKGLVNYINLKPVIVPRSAGRESQQQFHKSNMHIIERLMNHVFIPGHRGRKHLISSGHISGKSSTVWNMMKDMLSIIEKKAKKNPIEVVAKGIENAALREEITGYQVGGIIVRKAVITAPQRRVDLALRRADRVAVPADYDRNGCHRNGCHRSRWRRDRSRSERPPTLVPLPAPVV